MSAPPRKPVRPRAEKAPRVDAAELLDVLVEQVAARVAERMAPAPDDTYYDARSAPKQVGRRQFLKAAAAGSFPAFKVGNRVVARRADVHKWMESTPYTPPSQKDKAAARKERERAEDLAALENAGLRPRKPEAIAPGRGRRGD